MDYYYYYDQDTWWRGRQLSSALRTRVRSQRVALWERNVQGARLQAAIICYAQIVNTSKTTMETERDENRSYEDVNKVGYLGMETVFKGRIFASITSHYHP